MIKIVADSGCDILDIFKSEDFTKFESVPLRLVVDGVEYIDDENLDVDKFLEIMENSKSGSKSAAPSPNDFLKAFGDADEVYVLTISSKLSGSYNSANIAKQMYEEEFPERTVHVFDTKSATAGQTLSVLKLNEYIKEGLSKINIIKEMENTIDKMDLYFILDKYDNLVKNGRMNPLIAKFASTLSIKPICRGENGEVALIEKARGAKAYSKLVKLISEKEKQLNDLKSEFSVVITHVKCYDTALSIKKALEEKNCRLKVEKGRGRGIKAEGKRGKESKESVQWKETEREAGRNVETRKAGRQGREFTCERRGIIREGSIR